MQLLAVACLSIAAKMEETSVPLTVDLQVKRRKNLTLNLIQYSHCCLISKKVHGARLGKG